MKKKFLALLAAFAMAFTLPVMGLAEEESSSEPVLEAAGAVVNEDGDKATFTIGNFAITVPSDWFTMEQDNMFWFYPDEEAFSYMMVSVAEDDSMLQVNHEQLEEMLDVMEETILAPQGTIDTSIRDFTLNDMAARRIFMNMEESGILVDIDATILAEGNQLATVCFYVVPAMNETDYTRAFTKVLYSIKPVREMVEGLEEATELPEGSEAAPEEASGMYKDGVYTATTVGAAPAGSGDVNVTVTVENGAITSVEIDAPKDKASLGMTAIKKLPDNIIAAGGTEGVDTIAGCSLTSQAILDAVDLCLEQAK